MQAPESKSTYGRRSIFVTIIKSDEAKNIGILECRRFGNRKQDDPLVSQGRNGWTHEIYVLDGEDNPTFSFSSSKG
jgi:hypothetical protein